MKKTLAFLAFTFMALRSASAQYPVEVGIPAHVMNFCASAQDNSNWCWAASIQMVMARHGVHLTQQTIVGRSYGSDPYGNLPNWTGSLPVITANLNNWGMDQVTGQPYRVGCQVGMGPPPPQLLINELSQGYPVIIGYHNSSTPGHAVVITAAAYYPTPMGPNIVSITVRDPWPSPANIMNQGRVTYNAAELGNSIMAFWVVRVQH